MLNANEWEMAYTNGGGDGAKRCERVACYADEEGNGNGIGNEYGKRGEWDVVGLSVGRWMGWERGVGREGEWFGNDGWTIWMGFV